MLSFLPRYAAYLNLEPNTFSIQSIIPNILFIVILWFIPATKVRSIIKNLKYNYINEKLVLINNLEIKIHRGLATKLDFEQYEFSINMIRRAEKFRIWPFDLESIVKGLIALVIGIIPTILNYFLK